MANISTQIIKLSTFPERVRNMPANYPMNSAPGKIEKLLRANSSYYYHQFSPFTNYHDSILSPILSNKQPFVYTYIDDAQNSTFANLPVTVQGLAQIAQITPGTMNDVVRVSKFLISSWGVQFLITQAAVQRLAPFDETRIYNPASPILATIAPLTLGIGNMPMRHIEGGLSGVPMGLINSVTSTVGINLESGFKTPSSTVGDSALPKDNKGQGKGLIRGGGAGKGKARLQLKWPVTDTQSSALGGGLWNQIKSGISSGVSSMITSMGNAAGQMFGVITVRQPPDTKVRADESTYTLMALSHKLPKQAWYPSSGVTTDGGAPISTTPGILSGIMSDNTNGGGKQSLQRIIYLSNPDGTFKSVSMDSGLVGETINGKETGYNIKDGTKYGKVVGRGDDFKNSDILVQYSYYLNEKNNYPTKISDPNSDAVKKIQTGLKTIIDNINKGQYKAYGNTDSYLLPTGKSSLIGYNDWSFKSPKQSNTPKNQYGVTSEYYTGNSKTPSIDAYVKTWKNLRMATTFYSDGINSLGVVPSNKEISVPAYSDWKEWKPYEDDLIAFFFYDVVNEKYIPFRATVKGISEGATAFWDELRFIGRADQLYSYNGFSRTLNFSFNVVINSVTELLPSWKKINYMASAVKPSNYTTGQFINQKFNRFIVPPMFMLTIGDLYKFQPILITSITINIPEDASWETLNQDNSKNWSYLNGFITSPQTGKNYGQLPRECEIAVVCNLLEKERAIVGGSNFGHQPRTDDGNQTFYTDSSVPFLPDITDLHKGFVEWNNVSMPANPSISTGNVEAKRVAAANTPFTLLSGTSQTDATKIPTTSGIVANIPILPQSMISNVRINSVPVTVNSTINNTANGISNAVSKYKMNLF